MNAPGHPHQWKPEKDDGLSLVQRCAACGLFRMAKRSALSRQADEIVATYQRRGYHFLDTIEKEYEPKWIELTLEQIGEIVRGEKPFPVLP